MNSRGLILASGYLLLYDHWEYAVVAHHPDSSTSFSGSPTPVDAKLGASSNSISQCSDHHAFLWFDFVSIACSTVQCRDWIYSQCEHGVAVSIVSW